MAHAILSDRALSALSDLLDVNDDDEVMLEAGIDAAGLRDLRSAVAFRGGPKVSVPVYSPQTFLALEAFRSDPEAPPGSGLICLTVKVGDPDYPEHVVEAIVSPPDLLAALAVIHDDL